MLPMMEDEDQLSSISDGLGHARWRRSNHWRK
jgi:hypothetical protein